MVHELPAQGRPQETFKVKGPLETFSEAQGKLTKNPLFGIPIDGKISCRKSHDGSQPLWLLLVANFRLCYHCGNLAGPEGGCLVAISLNAPSPLLGLCRLSKFSLAANG